MAYSTDIFPSYTGFLQKSTLFNWKNILSVEPFFQAVFRPPQTLTHFPLVKYNNA